MNLISVLLICAAILNLLFAIALLGLWLRGINSILLPGLGIIVATPLIVLLLLIVEVGIVLLVILTKSGA
jgi:hypothetical protein